MQLRWRKKGVAGGTATKPANRVCNETRSKEQGTAMLKPAQNALCASPARQGHRQATPMFRASSTERGRTLLLATGVRHAQRRVSRREAWSSSTNDPAELRSGVSTYGNESTPTTQAPLRPSMTDRERVLFSARLYWDVRGPSSCGHCGGPLGIFPLA